MPQYAHLGDPTARCSGASDRMRSALQRGGQGSIAPAMASKICELFRCGSLKCRFRSYDHAIASRFPPVLAVYLENAFWNGLD
jgi:hypothetical protein